MRSAWGTAVAAVACGVLALAGCAQPAEPAAEEAAEGWQQVAAGPLSPREQALGLWTGREVLLIGGSDAPPCPPNASCAVNPAPLTDAAALDPATGLWRPIAAPPAPVLGAQGVVIGSTVYVLPYQPRAALLGYRVDQDKWSQLAAPPTFTGGYGLVAAGDRLVAYSGSDENGPDRDYLFDPATKKWTALPDDPLGAGFDRHLAWGGRELLLFDHKLVPNPNADGPALTRVAALDLDRGTWRKLPDLPMLSTGPWLAAGAELVNPTLGGADGGQVGNWGRTYPLGGILDPATGKWSALPDPPGGEGVRSAARTGDAALYPGLVEVVLSTSSRTWEKVSAPPGGDTTGETVVAAGARMVVFGGARWKGEEGKLLNATRIWTPAG
ncbi:hypothetical protein OWR29_03725 [Actinoplanes sp. Pm04-4]|uniref:Galactose oxidase n=1 Tax=Paractinoplanes pyxinae TaxID=2997416 RepID=A0ABT4AS67_9ACTN|nr:hypothetical protein [Actinoplanes pyxinae]MCY1137094.1 hypothetical protein [Actinoplanes pyxinae]